MSAAETDLSLFVLNQLHENGASSLCLAVCIISAADALSSVKFGMKSSMGDLLCRQNGRAG